MNDDKYNKILHFIDNNSGHNIQYVYIYIYCFNEKHEIKVNLYKSSFTGNNLNYTAVLD